MVTGLKTFLNGFSVQNNIVANGYISGKDIRNVVNLQGNEIIKSKCMVYEFMYLFWKLNHCINFDFCVLFFCSSLQVL